jgi:hypothetical protein
MATHRLPAPRATAALAQFGHVLAHGKARPALTLPGGEHAVRVYFAFELLAESAARCPRAVSGQEFGERVRVNLDRE